MKNTTYSKLIIYITIIAGIVMTAYSFFSKDETENYIETTATLHNIKESTVSREENEYTLIYKYIVNGKNYEIKEKIYSRYKPEISSYIEKKVKYNPTNPYEVTFSEGNPRFERIIIGVIITVVGVVIFIKMRGD